MGCTACLQERIEEAKRELEDAVERECTFAPVIDARSAGMMSHRTVVLKVRPAPSCLPKTCVPPPALRGMPCRRQCCMPERSLAAESYNAEAVPDCGCLLRALTAGLTPQDRKITAHEQLYQDGVRRQERQLTYASWVPDDVTFAPKIIRRAPETGKVSGHPGRKSTGNLAER